MPASIIQLFIISLFIPHTDSQYVIHGSFNRSQNEKWIYLVRFMDDHPRVDSTEIIDGKFTFKGTVDYPEVYGIHYRRDRIKGIAPIFLEPGDLEIVINLDDWTFGSKVTGGEVNQAYAEFAKTEKEKYSDRTMELFKKKRTAGEQEAADIDYQVKALMDADNNYKMDYVKAHPDAPESIFIFSQVFGTLSDEELEQMLSAFSPEIQNTIIYKNISRFYEMRIHPPVSEALVYDKEIKDLDVNFNKGPVIETLLQQNPEKLLYIDFWAPWCGPCIKAFPFSVKLRKNLNPDKIAFIYVCINANKGVKEEKWKGMIVKEQLKGQNYLWPEILINRFSKEIGTSILGIPHYVIIDQEGNIMNPDAPGPGSDQIEALLTEAIK